MFADAIESIGNFTRPMKLISRNYQNPNIVPGTGTLFFVNDEGYAITCKHVAELILEADKINSHYQAFKIERSAVVADKNQKTAIRKLEKKYNLNSGTTAQLKIQFPDCVSAFSQIDVTMHGTYDLALIHFVGHTNTHYAGHAIFAKDGNTARPGDMLCRLGFPFPEFTDFKYDLVNDEIDWASAGNAATPRFPIEGMFTRHLGDASGNIYGIELSTPGLKGQSGGPLFNSAGIVYGMQSMTHHLHLGFDMINEKMIINGKQENINNQPFLHVGQCIHVDVIKAFLDAQKVTYFVGDSSGNIEQVN